MIRLAGPASVIDNSLGKYANDHDIERRLETRARPLKSVRGQAPIFDLNRQSS
jgi:hypothetical protein